MSRFCSWKDCLIPASRRPVNPSLGILSPQARTASSARLLAFSLMSELEINRSKTSNAPNDDTALSELSAQSLRLNDFSQHKSNFPRQLTQVTPWNFSDPHEMSGPEKWAALPSKVRSPATFARRTVTMKQHRDGSFPQNPEPGKAHRYL